jgi:Ca-activated chloride channel family protein
MAIWHGRTPRFPAATAAAARPAAGRRTRLLAVLLLAILAAPALAPAAHARLAESKLTKEQKKALAALPAQYRSWLEEVEVLITKDERKAFLDLKEDYQRDAFIERFWEVRDRGGARGDFRRSWEARVLEARTRFGRLTDERARVYLLNGPPAALVAERCNILLWPVEAWFYHGSERLGMDFVVFFYQVWGAGPYRLWEPSVGLADLFQDSRANHSLAEIAGGCRNGDAIASAIAWVSNQGMGYGTIEAQFESTPKGPGGEWIGSFHSYSTDIPVGAPNLPAKMEVSYPGHYGERTMVQALVTVAPADAAPLQLADRRSYNLLLTGEVLFGGKLFENFRYKFEFPAGGQPASSPATLPLVVQRPLRPGEYTLIVKLEDLNSQKLCRLKQELAVPHVEKEAPPPPPADPESARLLAEANVAIGTGENTLKLIAPHGELQTGLMRFDTLVTGHDVVRVVFSLDGKAILTKIKPPYSVELDLGHLPRSRTLLATAQDAAGNQVASDELVINAPAHRFRVRLTEPQRGHRYESSLLARAETDVPEGESIDHVEFYLNEQLVATLYQAPYTQPIVVPKDQALAYVRAVAYTPDGNSTEDLVFVNAPPDSNLEQLNVQFVELYTSVLDHRGHPVLGLSQKNFAVNEDGVRQTISRFERVNDLPIHAAVVLDSSGSMEKSLQQARDAALGFLKNTIQPKDRAAVITFNDHPNIGVKFSNDLDTLAGGLAGLKAERGTSLWDTIIFTLFYFNGVKGQRAILLLTDGRDESSRFTFEDALEDARRAGVTIYTIGLGEDIDKRKLNKLSEETGGRAFFIKSAAELGAIYATIQEDLRSQYLIAYQSTNTSPENNFRAVDVKVDRGGVEVKTLHGYYP